MNNRTTTATATATATAEETVVNDVVTKKVGLPTEEQWAQQIRERVQGDFHLGYRNGNFERIEGWLNAKNSPLVSNQLARNLSATQPVGCCTMERFGKKVSLMCFLTENNEWVHLFVMDKKSVRGTNDNGFNHLSHGHILGKRIFQ